MPAWWRTAGKNRGLASSVVTQWRDAACPSQLVLDVRLRPVSLACLQQRASDTRILELTSLPFATTGGFPQSRSEQVASIRHHGVSVTVVSG